MKYSFILVMIVLTAGCSREWDNPIDIDIELAPPVIESLEINKDNYIQIHIQGSYSQEAEFVLERKSEIDYERINFQNPTQSVLIDTTFNKEVLHHFTYRIKIEKNGKSGLYSKEKSIDYIVTELNYPTNFHLMPVEGAGIKLTWVNKSHSNDGFIIQKHVNNESYEELTEVESDITSYFDSINGGFDPALSISFRIKAFNSELSSRWIEDTIEYSGINKPTNLQLQGIKPNGFEIIWVDNSKVETGYSLERKKDAGDFEVIALLESNTTYFLDNLSESGTVSYRIRAVKNEHYSPYSEEISFNSSVKEIDFGEVISEEIGSTGEIDIYKFTAEQGDIILIQSYSNDIHTRYELYNSDGVLIYEGGNGGWLRYRSSELTRTGKYTLMVMDNGSNNTGSYNMTIQRVNNPADIQEVLFGEIITDRINNNIELEVYSFTVDPNDVILLQSYSSEMNTRYELYDSDGVLIYEGGNGGWARHRLQLSKGGEYTLLVMDNGGNNAGSFNMTIQRVNNPADIQVISFGELITDRIDNNIEFEVYSFTTEVNDVILLQSYSSEMNTRYELYDSDGVLIYEGGNGGWARHRLQLSKGGEYTLLVMDYGGNNTGSYNMTIQRVNNPADIQAVLFGEIITDRIDNNIELEVYSFTVDPNDVILLQSYSSEMNTRYELYDSDGVLIYEGGNGGWARHRLQLSKGGKYTLLVMDYGGNNTGSYNMTIQRVNNPADIQVISFGELITDRIDNNIELEVYSFTTEVDDVVLIQSITHEINTRYELYNPDGGLVYEGGSGGWLRYSGKLTQAGEYNLMVMDYGGNNTGSFDITFQGLNTPANAISISKHDSLAYTTSNPLQIVTFSYTVETVDEVEITMGRTSESITPRIEVYDPLGDHIYSGNASTVLGSGKLQFNNPGVYTILTMDQNADGTGSFYMKIE